MSFRADTRLDGPPACVAMLLDWLAVLASVALLFIVAFFFFSQWLFSDYEVKVRAVQFLFALVFTLSLLMLELIIFEVMGVLDPASRRLCWKLVLWALCVLLIVVRGATCWRVCPSDCGCV